MRRPSIVAVAAISLALLVACGSGSGGAAPTTTAPSGTAASVDPGGVTPSVPASTAPASAAAASVSAMPSAPAALGAPSTAPPSGASLPLNYSTGSATQVITVVAGSTGATTARLQAWDKATTGTGWVAHGSAISAYVGSAGLTTHPSESVSATPIGSFTLTRAFGSLANPGTAITYHQTSSADWWISQAGPFYNTMQTCSSSCAFTLGDPNEHLAAITPEYRYAVVIDYNTAAPIVQDAGSAFFLHVANNAPTAGCVSIPQANLVTIMQWLNPSAQPRILIGVG